MASYLPPTENLPIFDNQVFNQNEIALTYSEARKYFVTFPSAQGSSTITDFIAGSIDYLSPSAGSFFEIGTNQVSGGTIRVGPTGGATGVSIHAGNIDFKNNTINNASNATGGHISLASTQTSGVLDIGTASRTTAGNINIGTGSGATANPITIGGAGSIITFGNSLVLGTSNYITTTLSSSAFTAPTAPTQVGCVVSGDFISATLPISDNVSSYGSITLKAGTWVITVNRQLNSTTGVSKMLFSFGSVLRNNVAQTSGTDYLYGLTSVPMSSSGVSFGSFSSIISITSGGDTIVYFNITPTYTTAPGTTTANFRLVATRIA
jgi:hypothetical protein